jgi:hypothetical protein
MATIRLTPVGLIILLYATLRLGVAGGCLETIQKTALL